MQAQVLIIGILLLGSAAASCNEKCENLITVLGHLVSSDTSLEQAEAHLQATCTHFKQFDKICPTLLECNHNRLFEAIKRQTFTAEEICRALDLCEQKLESRTPHFWENAPTYEEWNGSMTFAGPWSTNLTRTVTIVRSGKQVTLHIPLMLATAATSSKIYSTTGIPEKFRPHEISGDIPEEGKWHRASITVAQGTDFTTGMLNINAEDGTIEIYLTGFDSPKGSPRAFLQIGSVGLRATTVTYNLGDTCEFW